MLECFDSQLANMHFTVLEPYEYTLQRVQYRKLQQYSNSGPVCVPMSVVVNAGFSPCLSAVRYR